MSRYTGLSITGRSRWLYAGIGIGLILLALSCYYMVTAALTRTAHADSINTTDFVTTWRVEAGDTKITIPTEGTGYNYSVDWDNDGIPDRTGITGNTTYDFGTPGEYTIRISGNFPRIYNGSYFMIGNAKKLIDINQWGDNQWQSMKYAFADTGLGDISATDTPDLSEVTDMSYMFFSALSFNGNISGWDVSGVTNMNSIFRNAPAFTGDLSDWDVSSVTNLSGAFQDATSFAGNISRWDVSSAINMSGMFLRASSFTSDLSAWNVSNVTDMAYMFASATSFTSSLSAWNVSNVTDMTSMFYGTTAFDSDISGWDFSDTMIYGIFDMAGLSPRNYDALLQGWAQQDVQSDVRMQLRGLTYCDAQEARQYLIDHYKWRISGDSACARVSSVEFVHEVDRWMLKVNGTSLINSYSPYPEYESLVSLNGQPLPFCSEGVGDSYWVDSPSLISDEPPCYFYFSYDDETDMYEYFLTPTQALIWLPDNFDTTAEGTVSVNGSPAFTFNQASAPDPDPTPGDTTTPTANVKGTTKPLTSHPTIPARPTFTGTAEPGAAVKVTVHSDPVTCETTADSDGNWSCTLPKDLEPGEHKVYVEVTLLSGDVEHLGPYDVTVAGDGSSQPITNDTLGVPNTGLAAPITKWIVGGIGAVVLLGIAGIIGYQRQLFAADRPL